MTAIPPGLTIHPYTGHVPTMRTLEERLEMVGGPRHALDHGDADMSFTLSSAVLIDGGYAWYSPIGNPGTGAWKRLRPSGGLYVLRPTDGRTDPSVGWLFFIENASTATGAPTPPEPGPMMTTTAAPVAAPSFWTLPRLLGLGLLAGLVLGRRKGG